ncbi:uncharacterized protein LOC131227456 [Magnolia sinica]|uniref:uncharacterized protein LOC131227456 n=1 Tax=Magnolia sinica TaxID=86752 RepID=UPI00265A5DCC|nr:uncharacterized protein LOC131227456 [Magnolia sinica]
MILAIFFSLIEFKPLNVLLLVVHSMASNWMVMIINGRVFGLYLTNNGLYNLIGLFSHEFMLCVWWMRQHKVKSAGEWPGSPAEVPRADSGSLSISSNDGGKVSREDIELGFDLLHFMFNHLLERQYHLMKYPMPPKVPLAPYRMGFIL